jgi:hypothetical protein
MMALVALISAAPSGAPCAAGESFLVGAGKPMMVFTRIRLGRGSASALRDAAKMASMSSPSSTLSVCQP